MGARCNDAAEVIIVGNVSSVVTGGAVVHVGMTGGGLPVTGQVMSSDGSLGLPVKCWMPTRSKTFAPLRIRVNLVIQDSHLQGCQQVE